MSGRSSKERLRRISPLVLAAALAGCEPGSITEARDQLSRGPASVVTYALPIARDTFYIDSLLGSDTTRTPDGRRAVTFSPEVYDVAVGEKLKFDNLSFTQFKFSYDQMLQTRKDSVSITIASGSITLAPLPSHGQSSGDTIRFHTPEGSSVTGASVAAGSVIRTLTNNSGCDATLSVSLKDSTGADVVAFSDALVPDGGTVVDTTSLAGSGFQGYVRLAATGAAPGCTTLDPFGSATVKIVFSPLTLASVTLRNVNESFSSTYAVFSGEPRLLAVDTVAVHSGSFTLTVQNRLPISVSADLKLNGVLFGGTPYRDTILVNAAPGDGSAVATTVNIDLAGAKIVPGDVVAEVLGRATASQATVSPTVTTDAVVVDGGGNLVIQSITGTLDPAVTPELNVSVEEFQEIDVNLDSLFGDLKDALRDATLNDVTVTLTVRSGLGAELRLSNFYFGVVELTSSGQLPRDGSGNIVFQKDAQGNPLLVLIADSGQTTLTVPAKSGGTPTVKTVALQVAPLIDRVVDLLLDGKRAGLVASGTASARSGTTVTVTRADSVGLTAAIAVALDVTIPTSGVQFSETTVQEGLDFDPKDADQIANRVDSATARSVVVNRTPFGVRVFVALVPDSLPGTVKADSIFRRTDRVELAPVELKPAQVDAQGRVTQPVTDTVSVSISGQQSRVLFGKHFTAGIRIVLLPGNAAGGRGAIRPEDHVILNASARVRIKTGGAR
ncbi:MAG: hypothetical protein KatS3mg081_2363 [Gemmatimonadales bacterium]|nr:MAG: hypothetical protein KatS3mg081_2363 [Gemmatimonadales bacterium]